MGPEGLSFYNPNQLCCLDQMLAVMELSQHLVSSSKTVRPIIPRGAQCVGHVEIMWSAVCALAPHLHFAEGARPHLCMEETKRPTPVRRRLSLTQAVLVKLIPMGLVLTLGMCTPSADMLLEYSVSHVKHVARQHLQKQFFQFSPLQKLSKIMLLGRKTTCSEKRLKVILFGHLQLLARII